jgi:hypothetical protein
MRKALIVACFLTTSALGTSRPAPAAFLELIGNPSGGTPGTNPADNTMIGYRFPTPSGIPYYVTSLGIADLGDPGLNEAHTVSLWTELGALLASVTIPAGADAPLSSTGYRFVDLATPVLLASKSTYVVGAFYPSGTGSATADQFSSMPLSSARAIQPPNFGLFDARVGSGPGFPTTVNSTTAFIGPNMGLSNTAPVPEPSSLALMILGAGGLFGFCWRRRLARPAS